MNTLRNTLLTGVALALAAANGNALGALGGALGGGAGGALVPPRARSSSLAANAAIVKLKSQRKKPHK